MKTFRHSYGVALSTVLVSGAAFIGLVITSFAGLLIARSLSPTDYGAMTYFMGWFAPLLLILGLGMSTRVIKMLAPTQGARELDDLSPQLYTLLVMRLATLTLLPILGAGVAALSGQRAYLLVAAAAAAAVINDFLLGLLRGRRRATAVAVALVFQPSVYLALLAGGLGRTVEGALQALILSFSANVLLELLWLRLSKLLPAPRRPLFVPAYARELIGASSRIYLVGLYQTIFGAWLMLSLGSLGKYQSVAELSIPLTLVGLLTSVNAPILVTMVLPRLARVGTTAAQSFDIAYRLIWAVALAGTTTLGLFAAPLIRLLYSDRYVHTAPLLTLLAPLVAMLAIESLMTMTQIGLDQYRTATRLQLIRLALLIVGSGAVLLMGLERVAEQVALSLVYLGAVGVGLAWQLTIVPSSLQVASRLPLVALGSGLAVAAGLAVRSCVAPGVPLWVELVGAVGAGAAALTLTTILFFYREIRHRLQPWASQTYRVKPLAREEHEL